MRRKLRIDFVIAALAAFGIGALIQFCGKNATAHLENDTEEKVFSNTEVGAAAGEDVTVVSNIEEMLENERFTFHVDEYQTGDYVYYEGTMYSIYELESGEKVLVDEYLPNSYYAEDEQDNSFVPDGYLVMPVGTVVLGQLDEALIEKIEEQGHILADTSFYVDMRGNYKEASKESARKWINAVSWIVGMIVFFLVRYVSVASGFFPPIVPLRFLKTWKKFINYYGVIYYDENVEQIFALHKQGKLEEAAAEFAELTGVEQEEAKNAMGFFEDICGEGILHV